MLKRNSLRLFLVCVLGSGLLCDAFAGESSGRLISDHRAIGVIVTRGEPTRAEQFAAEELQTFLMKITGVQVAIEKTDRTPDGPAIIVGSHPANADVIRRLESKYPITPGSWATAGNYDAFAVVSDGQRLQLVGNSSSALLYAAWDWLESLGVRWIFPTELGTYVPAKKEISFAPAAKYDGPAIAYRGPAYATGERWKFPPSSYAPEHGVATSALYGFRMRLNHNVVFDPKDSFFGLGSGHSYMYLLPVERYYAKHPEWYNLIGGKRQNVYGWQVCFTNREAAKECASNVIIGLKSALKQGVPIERVQISISPNDARAWCECSNCQKLIDADGGATSMVTNFANMVAQEVRKTYPTARFMFYAYNNHTRLGDKVKPGPGVCPELTFWSSNQSVGANSAHPMFSDKNDKYRRYFKEYAQVSEGITSHPYYGHYIVFTPWPMLDQMAHDIPIMCREPKFYGMYSESHLHWGTQGPNFYLHPKLMWNPKIDVQAVMDDYYAKGFGSAGPHIKRYFGILQRKMNSLPYVVGYLTEIPTLLTPEVITQCNECIGKAEQLLPTMDAGTRWRTELMTQGWRYSAKTAQAIRMLVNPNPKPGDGEKITRLLSDVNRFVETEQGKWVFEYYVTQPNVENYLKPFLFPARHLPKGESIYNDCFSYGGAIKFVGKTRGFTQSIWGYYLPAEREGLMELPLRAEAGNKITAVTVCPITDCGDNAEYTIMAVNSEGKTAIAHQGKYVSKTMISVPAAALGGRDLTLRLIPRNTSTKDQLVFVSLYVNVKVEPASSNSDQSKK